MFGNLGMSAAPALALRPSAAMVAFAELLAMPSTALEERVAQELERNPALCREERPGCRGCGGPAALCGGCRGGRWEGCWADRAAPGMGADPLGRVVQQEAPVEGLRRELRLLVAGGDQAIAEWLVGSLDRRGRLEVEVEEVADALGVPVGRVLGVLALLRRVAPAGVGAVDARDCLLLQLDRVEDELGPQPLARQILEHHLDSLAAGRLRVIAAATGTREPDVAAARELIRTRLRPYPSFDGEPGDPLAGPRAVPLLQPDLVIGERAGEPGQFDVRLVEPDRLALTVDPLYLQLATQGGGDRHVTGQVRRARLFLARLQQRWQTMQAVAEYVVGRQRAFLSEGPIRLAPLRRAEVAAALGLHESTVSRAVAGKHALLPSRRVMPVAGFFGAAPGAHEALRQLIAAQDRPMSDGELATALAGRGYQVARRTVAKYRGQLGIPASTPR